MDRLETMRAFWHVANEGSFTRAADRLSLSPQLVSKYVSQLEDHLGTRLLNRTTRRVHLTEAGERSFQQIQHILESVSDMEGQLDALQQSPRGVLRISAPVSFAAKHLAPLIRDFKAANQNIQIDLNLNDRKVDVVEEGFDLALRIGNLKSSSLIAKRIAPIRLVICASPDYLKRNGTPVDPMELIPADHLKYSYMDLSQQDSPLMQALKRQLGYGEGVLACNNGDVLTSAAIAGMGYVVQPTFLVGEAIRQKKLKIILEEFEPKPLALYAVFPHRTLPTTKLRRFLDFIDSYYGEPPYWDAF